MKEQISDIKADQNCMSECVKAFEVLSRHYCDDPYSNDSIAVGYAQKARLRVLQWMVSFIQDHPHF